MPCDENRNPAGQETSSSDPAGKCAKTADIPCCPVCGGALKAIQCKVFCSRCRALVANCNGD